MHGRKAHKRRPSSLHLSLSASIGFSMIELLVALTIVGLMIFLLTLSQGLQLSRGEDAARKSDLARLKIVFEDYYNDHGCYPPQELLNTCFSGDLQPYLPRVPCDPRTKTPYTYYHDEACKWYVLFTHLEDPEDRDIGTLSCTPTCGVVGTNFNYYVSNNAYTISETVDQVNEMNGNSGGEAGNLACDQLGICNVYADPASHGCPVTFTDAAICQNACSNPANRCTD